MHSTRKRGSGYYGQSIPVGTRQYSCRCFVHQVNYGKYRASGRLHFGVNPAELLLESHVTNGSGDYFVDKRSLPVLSIQQYLL